MSVTHEISIILDWSGHMAGQVEKPERCDVSGLNFPFDFMEPWLTSYCYKKCLDYNDVECLFCAGGDSIQYTRVDATHRFPKEIVAGQAFEIRIVTKPGVCYVAALRAQIEKVQIESNRYEVLYDAREAEILLWRSRYQEEHSKQDDTSLKLQTVTTEKNELQLEVLRLAQEKDRLEKELREAEDDIDKLHAEKVKYSKDLVDAHIRVQDEHRRSLLKRRGGPADADEGVSEMTDVPDVLDGLNARELGGRTVAWLRNAKAKASQFVQKLVEAEDTLRAGIPDSHVCPITQDVMKDPWILKETGQSYEYDAIKKWLARVRDDDGNVVRDDDGNVLRPTCPKTNLVLTTTELIRNHALRNSIEETQARV